MSTSKKRKASAIEPDLSGAFHPIKPKRVLTLEAARQASQESQPFLVQPGGSNFGVYEGFNTQIAPKQDTYWQQIVAKPSEVMSTKYTELFPALSSDSDLSRANKALVTGGRNAPRPKPGKGRWQHHKSYTFHAQLTATLLRVNESFTALGKESMGLPKYDAGTGIVAEALALKWKAKNQGKNLNMKSVGAHLTDKFPQLDTTEKMRKKGKPALLKQIADSRMSAAVMAAKRAEAKGKSDLKSINKYVQRKFAKHGLGPVPGGWAAKFKAL
ncbi:hypothetical protein [Dyella nitratireducens]|uniref:Uncharacterized protein n=1 Tax=Dyella nitratireducens TaxID=1849580 RepID=A0ABQ1FME8_9GAMM|nr:hypothetical protein [Dyella nitratireducens]GGA20937.1 hypothetical protein GCM10010981_06300 [Dyella nitratireducens]GLQ44308.1 hypothetical protein GCM10007902_41580 [Dyella nitratireducens]